MIMKKEVIELGELRKVIDKVGECAVEFSSNGETATSALIYATAACCDSCGVDYGTAARWLKIAFDALKVAEKGGVN
jgi:hypothetical protein